MEVALGFPRSAHPVHGVADLDRELEHGATGWGEATVEEWRGTLEWLLHQLKMGVHDPVAQLPDELLAPAGILAAVAGSISSEHPVASADVNSTGMFNPRAQASPPRPSSNPSSPLDALKEWRRAGIDSGRGDLSNLKESQIAQIVRSNRITAEAIAAILPPAVSGLAAEIAGVIDSVKSVDAEAQPAADAPLQAPPHTAPPVTNGRATPSAVDGTGNPATTSAPAPSARGRRANSPVGTFLPLDPHDFEEFDYSSVPGTVHQIKAATSAAGVVCSWPAYEVDDCEVAVYRLVSNNDFPPYAPERGDYIGATTDIKVSDGRPFESAVRFVQVWVNVGADIDDAAAAQPVLHADTAVVSPVADVEIREDEGRVIGQWTVFPGVSAVQVYRIPIERAAFGGDDPQYRIAVDEPNLGGFIDRTAERGKRYIYRVRAEAAVDGTTRLSSHTQAELLLSAVLEAVTDLAVVTHGDDDDPQFDLTWTAPAAGRVVIYRTVSGPNPGVEAEALPEASLASAGLPVDNRLSHPVIAGAPLQTSTMACVPWPREWNRAYFTAVTVLGDRVQVGSTTSATRTGSITHAQVVERVNKQILTFAWPAGAAYVLVHIGPRGHSAEQGISGEPIEISSEMYERFGGLHFTNSLPNGGCALHLIPVAFAAARRVHGKPVTVDYPGLLRVYYDATVARSVTGKPVAVTVRVAAEMDVEGSPPFVLIHNEDRLPLNARDGRALDVVQVGLEEHGTAKNFMPPRLTNRPDGPQFRAEVKDQIGFVRLFAQLPAARLSTFALMDPPVGNLTLQHRRRR